MVRSITFTIDSHLANVALVAMSLRSICSLVALSPEELDELEIGVVEALNNVIKHGYEGTSGLPVTTTVELEDHRVTVQISDRGKRIPAELLDRARTSCLDINTDEPAELPESGMGLYLIASSVSSIDYHVGDGINTLKLEKIF
jgi:serine/threonine-protein kinase RsbW